ncbi:DUF3489 domain-containing protein [Brevundimonas sp.]|uniref:DUF3489 domain-containing protein n=1 Tax=Brevundimonas sp. TaxID=1871086 RepID=UPI002897B3CE|nr:DUF3489 domain-containing protein [Brevundimonas sp.]
MLTFHNIEPQPVAKVPSKQAQLITLLQQEGGATMKAMTQATGWQPHSVRGAIAGVLRKKGYLVQSYKHEGTRYWSIQTEAGQ